MDDTGHNIFTFFKLLFSHRFGSVIIIKAKNLNDRHFDLNSGNEKLKMCHIIDVLFPIFLKIYEKISKTYIDLQQVTNITASQMRS